MLFDSGPGIVRKLLEVGLSYHDIDYIFYSHFHTDHTLDLAAFLFAAKYALSLRTKKLTLIVPQGLRQFYESLIKLYGEVISPESDEVVLQEIGEEELSPLDKQYLKFGEAFEMDFLNQGEYENRSIETTLELGWDALSVLPMEELHRVSDELLKKHYRMKRETGEAACAV